MRTLTPLINMTSRKSKYLQFNTAIITYPSDTNKLIDTKRILQYYQENQILFSTTKLVIAQEDPDDEIQRIHFHLYWDDLKRKQVNTKYFDIPLEYPIIVFIHPDKTREYSILSEMESQLGWDNSAEMVAKLEHYIQESGYESYEILNEAHPNILLRKKCFGSKYEMLRYVLKQKLLKDLPKKLGIEKELEWLYQNYEPLQLNLEELLEKGDLMEWNIKSVDELIELAEQLKARKSKEISQKKRGRQPKSRLDDNTKCFVEKLRCLVLENRMTKPELISLIKKNPDMWSVYSQSYLNYSKLINDMFKNRSPSKPKRNYDFVYYLPRKLYNYLTWLDDWIRRWMSGETMESRPKGLVLIGPSRTGKTSLISLFGEFSYFKNIWNVDNWEGLTPFTVMDDMDAGDEGKGLPFSWFKPFFGAQDAITVTDKFKPKQDIVNGKPLIWLNNYDYRETFQSRTSQDYIERNMEIIYIHQPLFQRPEPLEWIEGHSDYVEYNPKTTWYYRNVIKKTETETEPEIISEEENEKLIETQNDKEDLTNKEKEPEEELQLQLNDQQEDLELEQELQPLSERKAQLTEFGRPSKRTRTKY